MNFNISIIILYMKRILCIVLVCNNPPFVTFGVNMIFLDLLNLIQKNSCVNVHA